MGNEIEGITIPNLDKSIAKTTELSVDTIKDLREQCKKSFYFFLRGVLNQDFLYPPLHMEICKSIQTEIEKEVPSPILLVLPRGFLKSTIVSFGLLMWLPIKFGSNIRILSVTNTIANSAKFGRKVKITLEFNQLYRLLFPEFIPKNLNKQKWADTCFCLNRSEEYQESTFEFASLGTNITSRHYNVIVSDDLLSPRKDNMTGSEIMPTYEDVEKAIGWHKLLDSIFVSDPKMPNILIDAGTRWCKYDYIQHIIDTDKRYRIIDIPAIIDNKPTYPTRFPFQKIEDIQERQGTYIFSSQYMNRPYDPSQMVFNPDKIRYYTETPKNLYVIIANDPAWSKSKSACMSVILALGIDKDKNIYVLEYFDSKITPNELVAKNISYIQKYTPKKVSLETTAAQVFLLTLFKNALRDRNEYVSFVEYKPKGDKAERLISTIEPVMSEGKLYIKYGMNEMERQLFDFPFGRLRDVIDALAQGINVLQSCYHTQSSISNVERNAFSLEAILEDIDGKYNTKTDFFKYQKGQLQLSYNS